MPSLMGPQSQTGVMSFYDAQTNGPKINPKMVLIAIMAFAIVMIIVDHLVYF